MLVSGIYGEPSCQGAGPVAVAAVVPEPLKVLLERIEQGILDLARGADPREAMHALRSSLSDICALTEADPRTLQAVERVVSAGERLAEIEDTSLRSRAAARGAATRARKRLAAALVGTRPSRIAMSLGRGW
ncbi:MULTISPECIES: hypothetical protein [Methylobacterium]|uniref:hypothetical protein n=1 Tax=Methylobacterium TaxID=407 RepID=UPI00272E1642|nr:hypothetical protein [Methylobacterium sp.]